MSESIAKTETHALTVDFPAPQTQRVRALLESFVLRDPELGGVESVPPQRRRITLHPRTRTVDALPTSLREELSALEVRWGTRSLGALSPTTHHRLFTVLFFSGSKPGPALAPGLPSSWRRVLSNFYGAELLMGWDRYASVEHWFQAEKARCSTHPEMAARFKLDNTSPDAVGPDPAAAKKAGARKAYVQLGATLNTEAWLTRRVPAMREALEARWVQQPLFQAVLKSTAGMNLLHFERSGARSFWGGSISRASGLPQGENQLGVMLMRLRDTGLSDTGLSDTGLNDTGLSDTEL